MISNKNYVRLMPALLVATSLFLSACQGSKQDFTSRKAKLLTGAENQKVQGRMVLTEEMKQFIADPTTLPAYKSNLSEVFDKLSAESNFSWSSLFKVKMWLVGSEELTKQATEAISLTLDTTGTKYIVRQTQYEVLVDEAYLKKMTAADQSKLIVREYLTSLYTLKHLSDEQLCVLMKESLSVKTCPDASSEESGNGIVPSNKVEAEKEVPLTNKAMTKADTDKVELVAKFFEAQGANITAKTLHDKMSEQGFDLRIFDYVVTKQTNDSENTVTANDTIEVETLKALIEQMKKAADEDMLCQTLKDDSSGVKCHMSVESMSNKSELITLAAKAGSALVVNDTIYGTTSAAEIKVMAYKNKSGAEFIVVPLTSVGVSEQKAGVKYRGNYILARVDDKGSFTFAGLISVAGVIKNITTDETTQKKSCSGQKDTEGVSLVISKEANLTQSDVLQRNPAAPCW